MMLMGREERGWIARCALCTHQVEAVGLQAQHRIRGEGRAKHSHGHGRRPWAEPIESTEGGPAPNMSDPPMARGEQHRSGHLHLQPVGGRRLHSPRPRGLPITELGEAGERRRGSLSLAKVPIRGGARGGRGGLARCARGAYRSAGIRKEDNRAAGPLKSRTRRRRQAAV